MSEITDKLTGEQIETLINMVDYDIDGMSDQSNHVQSINEYKTQISHLKKIRQVLTRMNKVHEGL